MIEFVVVDHPAVKPQCCVVCSSATGPLIDTIGERWGDRIYICKLCVKRAATLLGFVKGAKADELDNALEVVSGKDREIDGLTAEVRELRAKVGREKQRAQAVQATLEVTLDRERTRAHLAHEIVGAANQLLTVGEPVLEPA